MGASVRFVRLVRVVLGVQMMRMRDHCMVRRTLDVARTMTVRSFAIVMRGLFVMFCGFLEVLGKGKHGMILSRGEVGAAVSSLAGRRVPALSAGKGLAGRTTSQRVPNALVFGPRSGSGYPDRESKQKPAGV